MIKKCPTCRELLVFPRGHKPYCEDCGWPDSDFVGTYTYPQEGADLSRHQPGLQFYDGKKWVESGLISGHQSESFLGLYRYKTKSGGRKLRKTAKLRTTAKGLTF